MKIKVIATLILVITFKLGFAQFALEKTYDHSLNVTRINETEYKFFLMDVAKSECRIYNLDHTLWKTIPIPLPTDYYLHDIKFVTQNLFNSNSNIELWYSAYKWVETSDGGYYRYQSKVISESGATLANIENGAYASLIKAGDNLYKLAIYAYDNSFWPGSVKTSIFSIPGTATAAVQTKSALLDPYPNPAENTINLPMLPMHKSGTLQVFSISGQLKLEQAVGNQDLFRLDTQGWQPGIYSYRVITAGGTSDAKKFMVR